MKSFLEPLKNCDRHGLPFLPPDRRDVPGVDAPGSGLNPATGRPGVGPGSGLIWAPRGPGTTFTMSPRGFPPLPPTWASVMPTSPHQVTETIQISSGVSRPGLTIH